MRAHPSYKSKREWYDHCHVKWEKKTRRCRGGNNEDVEEDISDESNGGDRELNGDEVIVGNEQLNIDHNNNGDNVENDVKILCEYFYVPARIYMFIDLRETDLLPGSQFCNEIYAILHSAKTNNNTMKPINRAKQRWVRIGRPKIVKVWTCETDNLLALPAKLIHGPAFVVHDYIDSAIENKSEYWFEIMPKDKWA